VSLETPSLRTRRYEPSQALPADRPQVPTQPCAACGAEVDPLRAPCVLAFEDGVRLLCSEDCKKNHRSGERSRRKQAPLTSTAPAPNSVPPVAITPTDQRKPNLSVVETNQRIDPLDRTTAAWVWVGAATVGTSATLACFAGPQTAIASAFLTTLAALAALRLTAQTVPDIGVLAWLIGPLGAIAATATAYSSTLHGEACSGAGCSMRMPGARSTTRCKACCAPCRPKSTCPRAD
jgi:hypothetical protein